MGWSISYDSHWERFVGYGVPATCDHPKCSAKIDRGLSYVCGGQPYGGEKGCGLFFCAEHLIASNLCPRCAASKPPYKHPKPERAEWVHHLLTDASWATWRSENPGAARALSGSPIAVATSTTPEGGE